MGPDADQQNSEYVLTKNWSNERERLELLEGMADEFSIDTISAAGFQRGWRCLDVGAGSGSIARWLARETGDPSLVTATDLDVRWLSSRQDEGVRILRHDVAVDDFPRGSFDLIHARCVLEHVVARDEVVGRVAPWLSPDGVLVIVDCASFPVLGSHNPIYRAAMSAWVDVIAKTGTNYDWTRSLPMPLLRHGYRDVGARALCPMLQGGTGTARFWSLTLETLRTRIIQAGILTNDAIDDAQTLLADPQFWDLAPGFVAAWGKGPT
jgi:ubiquinone/menaquinone biosynthesis C-methylase UbiE